MPVLTATTLRKSFNDLTVIDGVSLEISAGETIAILGASGCGKTTLLRLIAGLEKPDAGHIRYDWNRPGHMIGFQAAALQLVPWRNVRDNIALGIELTGTKKSEARAQADAWLSKVNLSGDLHPQQLSSGMTQRALLARTLTLSPTLLLLDEPLSNLDIIGRQQLGVIIKDYIKAQQIGCVIVTHSVEEACAIADRVLVISQKPAKIVTEIKLTGQPADIANVHQALVASIQAVA